MGSLGTFKITNKPLDVRKIQIPRNKLKNYILNPSKKPDKAVYFKSLGYNMKNYDRLIQDIEAQLTADTSTTLHSNTNEYGDSMYQVFMYLGIGKKSFVKTLWILKKGTDSPQFVTAYPTSKKENSKYEKK